MFLSKFEIQKSVFKLVVDHDAYFLNQISNLGDIWYF